MKTVYVLNHVECYAITPYVDYWQIETEQYDPHEHKEKDFGKTIFIDYNKALEKIEKLNKLLEEEFQKDTEYNRWLWKITDGKVGFKCHE